MITEFTKVSNLNTEEQAGTVFIDAFVFSMI